MEPGGVLEPGRDGGGGELVDVHLLEGGEGQRHGRARHGHRLGLRPGSRPAVPACQQRPSGPRVASTAASGAGASNAAPRIAFQSSSIPVPRSALTGSTTPAVWPSPGLERRDAGARLVLGQGVDLVDGERPRQPVVVEPGPKRLVPLAGLVARVDDEDAQPQRRAPEQVGDGDRLEALADLARGLGVAVAGQVDEVELARARARPASGLPVMRKKFTSRVRPGAEDTRASPRVPASAFSRRALADVGAAQEGHLRQAGPSGTARGPRRCRRTRRRRRVRRERDGLSCFTPGSWNKMREERLGAPQ